MPGRVVLQDFTGVPAVVDLAAMRGAMVRMGGDPDEGQPARALRPRDRPLRAGRRLQLRHGPDDQREKEFERNRERYEFLKWGQQAFDNFRVVPPATGIVHQVNLEYLAKVVWDDGRRALSRLARRHRLAHHHDQRPRRRRLGRRRHRGRGGHARPADLHADPRGRRLPADRAAARGRDGDRPRAARDADAARARRRREVRRVLRPGPRRHAARQPRDDRQHGARVRRDDGLLPGRRADARTTCGSPAARRELVETVEQYCQAQGLWRDDAGEIAYADVLELDLRTVEPALAGPEAAAGPDRARRHEAAVAAGPGGRFGKTLPAEPARIDRWDDEGGPSPRPPRPRWTSRRARRRRSSYDGRSSSCRHGAVVIAAITSCTNTSQPRRHDRRRASSPGRRGAAGSRAQAVGQDVARPGLEGRDRVPRARRGCSDDLEALGFYLVGYGCTTCIGNSGPLPEAISRGDQRARPRRRARALAATATSRAASTPTCRPTTSPRRRSSWRTRWPAPSTSTSTREPIGQDDDGQRRLPARHLADAGGDRRGGAAACVDARAVHRAVRRRLRGLRRVAGDPDQRRASSTTGPTTSTYIQEPPFFVDMTPEPRADRRRSAGARAWCKLGDSVTTDHISPAGAIAPDSPGREVPGRARRAASHVQQLRLAPRQRPRDDARHVRQHPRAQPARAGHRGRLDDVPGPRRRRRRGR